MGLHCDNCDKAQTKKSVWHCGCVMCPDLPAATPQNKALSQWVRATHSPVFVVFRTRFVKYCPTTAGPSDTVGVSVCVWTCEPTLSFCGNDLSQGAGGSQAETRSTDLLRQRCCYLLRDMNGPLLLLILLTLVLLPLIGYRIHWNLRTSWKRSVLEVGSIDKWEILTVQLQSKV